MYINITLDSHDQIHDLTRVPLLDLFIGCIIHRPSAAAAAGNTIRFSPPALMINRLQPYDRREEFTNADQRQKVCLDNDTQSACDARHRSRRSNNV